MSDARVKLHISLSVSDLQRSLAFYQLLFGQAPAIRRDDYAKFELEDPPLVFSLSPGMPAAGGVLNHLGLRLADSAALVSWQARLEAAGLRTRREENVACCYSRQTKFWVADPDRALWEFYVLAAEAADDGSTVPAAGDPAAGAAAPANDERPFVPLESLSAAPARPALVLWQHVLLQPVPEQIEAGDRSVDEARLEGTFNADVPPERLSRLLAELRRVLKPGGRLRVHGLMAERPLARRPELTGPAALVERVPPADEPARLLREAGFSVVDPTGAPRDWGLEQDGIRLLEFKLEALSV